MYVEHTNQSGYITYVCFFNYQVNECGDILYNAKLHVHVVYTIGGFIMHIYSKYSSCAMPVVEAFTVIS